MTIGGASRVRGMVASILVGVLTIVGLTSIGVMSAAAADSDTIASLVNQARAANGQAGLLRNGQLDAVAVGWANQMAANGAMAHNPNLASQVPGADAGAAIAPEPTPSPSASPRATSPTSRHPDPSPGSAEITLVATKSPDPNAAGATFPIGYLIGILLVVVGVAGGIYGRLLRRRGRRPFTS